MALAFLLQNMVRRSQELRPDCGYENVQSPGAGELFIFVSLCNTTRRGTAVSFLMSLFVWIAVSFCFREARISHAHTSGAVVRPAKEMEQRTRTRHFIKRGRHPQTTTHRCCPACAHRSCGCREQLVGTPPPHRPRRAAAVQRRPQRPNNNNRASPRSAAADSAVLSPRRHRRRHHHRRRRR